MPHDQRMDRRSFLKCATFLTLSTAAGFGLTERLKSVRGEIERHEEISAKESQNRDTNLKKFVMGPGNLKMIGLEHGEAQTYFFEWLCTNASTIRKDGFTKVFVEYDTPLAPLLAKADKLDEETFFKNYRKLYSSPQDSFESTSYMQEKAALFYKLARSLKKNGISLVPYDTRVAENPAKRGEIASEERLLRQAKNDKVIEQSHQRLDPIKNIMRLFWGGTGSVVSSEFKTLAEAESALRAKGVKEILDYDAFSAALLNKDEQHAQQISDRLKPGEKAIIQAGVDHVHISGALRDQLHQKGLKTQSLFLIEDPQKGILETYVNKVGWTYDNPPDAVLSFFTGQMVEISPRQDGPLPGKPSIKGGKPAAPGIT